MHLLWQNNNAFFSGSCLTRLKAGAFKPPVNNNKTLWEDNIQQKYRTHTCCKHSLEKLEYFILKMRANGETCLYTAHRCSHVYVIFSGFLALSECDRGKKFFVSPCPVEVNSSSPPILHTENRTRQSVGLRLYTCVPNATEKQSLSETVSKSVQRNHLVVHFAGIAECLEQAQLLQLFHQFFWIREIRQPPQTLHCRRFHAELKSQRTASSDVSCTKLRGIQLQKSVLTKGLNDRKDSEHPQVSDELVENEWNQEN